MADWEINGATAIKIARKEDPIAYVKVVASLVPKELEIVSSVAAELGDDELASFIEMLRERLRASVVDTLAQPANEMMMIEARKDVAH